MIACRRFLSASTIESRLQDPNCTAEEEREFIKQKIERRSVVDWGDRAEASEHVDQGCRGHR